VVRCVASSCSTSWFAYQDEGFESCLIAFEATFGKDLFVECRGSFNPCIACFSTCLSVRVDPSQKEFRYRRVSSSSKRTREELSELLWRLDDGLLWKKHRAAGETTNHREHKWFMALWHARKHRRCTAVRSREKQTFTSAGTDRPKRRNVTQDDPVAYTNQTVAHRVVNA
jgi:hypothetical protein